MKNESQPQSSMILYQTEDGRTRIQCRFENETVWLTQALMAELFQIGVNTVNHHLKEIYDDGEQQREATIRQYRIVDWRVVVKLQERSNTTPCPSFSLSATGCAVTGACSSVSGPPPG